MVTGGFLVGGGGDGLFVGFGGGAPEDLGAGDDDAGYDAVRLGSQRVRLQEGIDASLTIFASLARVPTSGMASSRNYQVAT